MVFCQVFNHVGKAKTISNRMKGIRTEALVFTEGNHIYIAPGQEKHLALEIYKHLSAVQEGLTMSVQNNNTSVTFLLHNQNHRLSRWF